MATNWLFGLGFTALPLLALLVGIATTVAFAYRLRDRRILLATLLFVLMASHQFTEVLQLLDGTDPHRNVAGEVFETSVNVLAVVAVVAVLYRLGSERRARTSLATVKDALLDNRPSQPEGDRPASAKPRSGAWISTLHRFPPVVQVVKEIARTLSIGKRARLDQALERATDTARLTFPIATFDLEPLPEVEVVANDTYLQEVFEVLFEQLVLHNDSSTPEFRIRAEDAGREVRVEIAHNGSPLPLRAKSLLEGNEQPDGVDTAELLFVETFVRNWGGDVDVLTTENGDDGDEVLRVTLAKPGIRAVFQ